MSSGTPELVLARARRRAATPAPTAESDAEWYAKMRGYLAGPSGQSMSPAVPVRVDSSAPATAVKATETDAEWYARMSRALQVLAARRAAADPTSVTPPAVEGEADVIETPTKRNGSPDEVLGLAVERYVRNYVTADGSSLYPRERARLETISARAIEICEQSLGPALKVVARRVIDSVQLSFDLDLTDISDEEAARAWGKELATAIRGRIRRGIDELGRGSWSGSTQEGSH